LLIVAAFRPALEFPSLPYTMASIDEIFKVRKRTIPSPFAELENAELTSIRLS
jgi:hypothetical protein